MRGRRTCRYGMQMRVSKGMGVSQRKRECEGRAGDERDERRLHSESASDESTIARWLCSRDEPDLRDAEDALQLSRGNHHRAGVGSLARRRLRKGGRGRGVEGDVAFDLLHDLVDVAVEHGDGAEALQVGERLCAILRAPAPVRIDHPERNVGKDDDGRRSRERGEVVLQPGELVRAEPAHGVDLLNVVEADEVHALVVEAVPAAADGSFAEAFEIERAVVGGGVVLAGNVEGLADLCALDDLLRGVELGRPLTSG